MWNDISNKQLAEIPRLYETEDVAVDEKLIYQHFWLGGSDWFVAEFDGSNLFFGYVVLNGDYQNSEWGYFRLSELRDIKVGWMEIDRDLHWSVKQFREIKAKFPLEGKGVRNELFEL